MQVVIDNLLTHYRDEGKGRVILMVHGWRHDLTTFDRLAAELIKSYRVIRLDLPGFGASAPQALTLDGYSLFLAHFLNKLQVKKLHCLVGHSMGGQIAIRAVGTKALQPAKLILLAAAGVRDTQRWRKRLYRNVAKTLKPIVPLAVKTKLYRLVGSDYNSSLSPAQKQTLDNVLSVDVQQDAAQLKLPTLLVYGEADAQTPVQRGQRFAELIDDSRLEVIPGAHHVVHQEQPEKVLSLMQSFLR